MTDVVTPAEPMPSRAARSCPMGPAPEFAVLRRTEPVSRVSLGDGTVVWLLTRFDDVRTVLGDPRFSSVTTRPGFPVYGLPGRDSEQFARTVLRLDDPEHMRLRRLVMKELTPKRITEYEPLIRRVVGERLDAIEEAGPPSDFVADFALALPSIVISHLLGVPQTDHDVFQRTTTVLTYRHATADQVSDALVELTDYMAALAAQKQQQPQDDIISRLVARETQGELTRQDLAAYAMLLVSAGHDTTAGALALSILTLIESPDQIDRLDRDPSLWVTATDELLRIHSVVRGGPRRLALEDVEIAGQVIRAGEGVMASVWAANHDDSHFPSAERFDLSRDNAASHLAFGSGTHQCLGQSLARAELRIGLSEVFRRFPALNLMDEVTELPFRRESTNYGLHALPLTW